MGSQARPLIRRAGPDDAGTVARIHVESWNVAYRGIMPDEVIARTDLAYRTAFWRERIAEEQWPVFLLDDGGNAVAFCQMISTPDPDDDPTRVGHITSLHVLPELRGKGYGHQLIEHVFAEFRERGFSEVTLWVLEKNRKARGFYEKSGFQTDGARQKYRDTEVPEVRYRIVLAVP